MLAAALSVLVLAASAQQPGLALRVVGLAPNASFKVDGAEVFLGEGDTAYSLPVDAKTDVVAGGFTLLLHRTRLWADAGDSFSFLSTRKGLLLVVHKGSLELAERNKPSRTIEAGGFLRLTDIL